MSLTVVRPPVAASRPVYSRVKAPVSFSPPDKSRQLPQSLQLRVPYFSHDGPPKVLVCHLAALWNYPSSYQLISKIAKAAQLAKSDLVAVTDKDLNALLLQENLISPSDAATKLFYMDLALLHSLLQEPTCLLGGNHQKPTAVRKYPANAEDDVISVSQVFPSYGAESVLPMNHASFLALKPLTKLQISKNDGTYRRIYGGSMSAFERDHLLQSNDYSSYDLARDAKTDRDLVSTRRPVGRQRRHAGSVDPNQLDVTENIIPGSGNIPEFNVNPICKVPNYFVKSNSQSNAQQNALFNPEIPHLRDLQFNYKDSGKKPSSLHSLLSSADHEHLHYKYYYYKSYRGPGSGNYKDAAFVNKINRISRFTPETAPVSNDITHLAAGRVVKPGRKNADASIKGLVHRFYSDDNVEIVTERQRRFTEDFTNLEMLHNGLQFNLLVNAYRDVASDTWKAYYKFKTTDFEKLYSSEQRARRNARKAELLAEASARQKVSVTPIVPSTELSNLLKPDISLRFSLPSDHVEIMEKLPLELRGFSNDPEQAMSRPIRYVTQYLDKNTPQVLNQVEVVKVPNANAIAWDNIKKYRRL